MPQVLEKVCCMRMSFLSISPSLSHVSPSILAVPARSLRDNVPDVPVRAVLPSSTRPESAGQAHFRTSTEEFGYLARSGPHTRRGGRRAQLPLSSLGSGGWLPGRHKCGHRKCWPNLQGEGILEGKKNRSKCGRALPRDGDSQNWRRRFSDTEEAFAWVNLSQEVVDGERF